MSLTKRSDLTTRAEALLKFFACVWLRLSVSARAWIIYCDNIQ